MPLTVTASSQANATLTAVGSGGSSTLTATPSGSANTSLTATVSGGSASLTVSSPSPSSSLAVTGGSSSSLTVSSLSPTTTLTVSPGGGGGGADIAVSSTPSGSPSDGDLWYDTNSGQTFIYLNDGNSSQWVPLNSGLVGAAGAVGQGFADYNDSATSVTPISLTSDSWTPITNDALGAFTNTTYIPDGVSSLFNSDKIDASELELGDAILIRYDFTITPTVNGAFAQLRLGLGTGLGSYNLNRPIGTLSNGSGYAYQITGEFYVYMGDVNTRDNPISLEIKCSEDATLVNAGVVIQVLRR